MKFFFRPARWVYRVITECFQPVSQLAERYVSTTQVLGGGYLGVARWSSRLMNVVNGRTLIGMLFVADYNSSNTFRICHYHDYVQERIKLKTELRKIIPENGSKYDFSACNRENEAQQANDGSLSNESDLSLIYQHSIIPIYRCRRGIEDVTVTPFDVVQYSYFILV